jgi:hypothetical protein
VLSHGCCAREKQEKGKGLEVKRLKTYWVLPGDSICSHLCCGVLIGGRGSSF